MQCLARFDTYDVHVITYNYNILNLRGYWAAHRKNYDVVSSEKQTKLKDVI